MEWAATFRLLLAPLHFTQVPTFSSINSCLSPTISLTIAGRLNVRTTHLASSTYTTASFKTTRTELHLIDPFIPSRPISALIFLSPHRYHLPCYSCSCSARQQRHSKQCRLATPRHPHTCRRGPPPRRRARRGSARRAAISPAGKVQCCRHTIRTT